MQAFFEFLAGVFAVLVAAALAQLGVDLEPRQSEPREIHRTNDCGEPANTFIATANRDC